MQSGKDYQNEFDSLTTLRRDSSVGPASFVVFSILWHAAGCRPGYIVTHTKPLAFETGRSRRAIEHCLAQLVRNGLIEIVERDKRRGAIHVYVFHPIPTERQSRPDPQTSIPFPELPPAGEELGAKTAVHSQERLAVCAPKPPSGGLAVSAPQPPTKTRETLENTVFRPPGLAVSAPKPPSAPLVPLNTKEFFYHRTIDSTNEFIGNDGKSTVVQAGPSRLGVEFADILAATADPAHQKRRLVQRIQAAVHDHRMAGYIAGAAADLVVYRGVPIEDLNKILGDVEAMREAGKLRSPGAFFHHKARELAGRHGKPWPAKGVASCRS